jgi:glycosyltransferase involved in cell wall biosynthesis
MTAATFHLGMLSPIEVADYRELLDCGSLRPDLPRGMGATPVNLLCRELLARGQRLTLFTLDPEVHDEVVLEGNNLRICIGPYGGPTGRRPARDFFAAERRYLLHAIARERPDVLHAQWTYLYALAAQASGRPHVITAHDAPLRVLPYDFTPYRIAHTLMAFRVLSRARHVVSVSPHVATHLRRWMLYRGAGEVIPNGMAERIFSRTTSRPGRDGAVTYATSLNAWSGLKNGKAALRAFGEVRRRRPADRLLMIGHAHGPGGPAETWARIHGLDTGVRFAGYLPYEETLTLLAEQVDVLVHPSREESFGMTLLEASAMAIPVIAGKRSGAVPWTLDGGRSGILVDVTSARALAEAMLELGGSEPLRVEWGARARENALRRFHVRTVADAYLETYQRLLGATA